MNPEELEIALTRASWQGALAVVFVALLCLLPRLSGSIKTALWRLVLVKFAAALLLGAVVSLPILRPEPPLEISTSQPEPTLATFTKLPERTSAPQVKAQTLPPAPIPSWLVVYGLGAAAFSLHLLRQAARTRRWRQGTQPVQDACVLAECAELAKGLKLWRVPELRQSECVQTPALTGVLKPTIVLPAALLSDSATLRLALAHELAHARRDDLAWNLFGALLRVVFWFHPLVWWSVRELAVSQEQACDTLAIRISAVAPATYGKTLLALAQPGALRTSFVSGSADHLKRRLRALKNTRRSPLLAVLALGLTGCALVPWQLTAARPVLLPEPVSTPKPLRKGTATISGQIRLANGRPAGNLRVWCNLLDEQGGFSDWGKSVSTRDSGVYSLDLLPAGTYRVCVETAGKDYTTRYKPVVTVKEGATKTNVDFDLQVGVVVEGTVRDLQGKPLPGVWVGGGPASGGRRDYTTYNVTDANGHYRIRVPTPDALIQLRSNPATGTLLDPEAQAQIVFTPRTSPTHDFQVAGRARQPLSAFLRTPEGTPIANAEIVTRLQRSKTDDRGYFQVKAHWGESEAPEEILVRQKGYTGKAQLTVGQEQVVSVMLQETQPAVITGQIVDEQGRPLESLSLAATRLSVGLLSPIGIYRRELSGNFEITLPSDSEYLLFLNGTSSARGSLEYYHSPVSYGSLNLTQLRSGERRNLGRIVLRYGKGTVTGVLRDGTGRTLLHQTIQARDLNGEFGGVTENDGTFRINGLPEGVVELSLVGDYKIDPITVLPGGPALNLYARRNREAQLLFHNYTLAQQEAQRRGVSLFVFLSTRTCANCRDFEFRVLPRPEVQAVLEGMVCVKLDADQNVGLARQLFGAEPMITPQFGLVTSGGKLLAKTDYSTAKQPADFVRWLAQKR
ncbi:M56 family metallopeptidase [Armatimonas sp.]|uniref:M56 family metallopeptidase n=1 Tax=Armatimonas sp. TaxID=1872638 RepID=UPI00286B942B|nr:M56 family metallopeptidase [Armatimonas sp.]